MSDKLDNQVIDQELLKAKKEAEDAIMAKTQFLSAISHELRTPMSTISSVANILLETEASDELKNYFNILKRSADNLFELLNDLRDLNNIETGSGVSKRRSMDLAVLAQTVLLSASVKAEEKGLSTVLEVGEEIPHSVTGNASTIRRVLTYLLGSAVKSVNVGTVSLELFAEAILEDHVDVLFVVKAKSSGKNSDSKFNYDTSDLGLTISQKLLDSHNSKVVVEEKAKEIVFSFTLSLETNQSASAGTIESDPSSEPTLDDMRAKLASKNVRNMGILETEKPSFTIENYAVLCSGDNGGLEELVKMTIQNLEKAKEDFAAAFKAEDVKEFELSAHEIMMAAKILQADRVIDAIDSGRGQLETKGHDKVKTKKAANELDTSLKSVISGLKDLLKTRFGEK